MVTLKDESGFGRYVRLRQPGTDDSAETKERLMEFSDEVYFKARGVLGDALARITSPAAWTKFTGARDLDGNPVSPISSSACQYCATGAIVSSSDAQYVLSEAAYELLGIAIGVPPIDNYGVPIYAPNISCWNDAKERTHAEVVAAFEKAIAI